MRFRDLEIIGRLGTFFRRVRTIYRNAKVYVPIIINDRDWDQSFFFELLSVKFSKMSKFFGSDDANLSIADRNAIVLRRLASVCSDLAKDKRLVCPLCSERGEDHWEHSDFSRKMLHYDYLSNHSIKGASVREGYAEKAKLDYIATQIKRYSSRWWD